MNRFDKNIKKKLYNAELPVSDGIWENIEAQIPVKQDKPRYWMLFLVLIFALPFLLYQFKTDTNSTTALLDKTDGQFQSQDSKEGAVQKIAFAPQNQSQRSDNGTDNVGTITSVDNAETVVQSSITSSPTPHTKPDSKTRKVAQEGNEPRIRKKSILRSTQTRSTNLQDMKSALFAAPIQTNENLSLSYQSNTKKKLKFLKQPSNSSFEKLKNGSNGNFKLIEKSRIFQQARKMNQLHGIAMSKSFQFLSLDYSRADEIGKRLLGLKKASPVCPSFKTFRSGLYFYTDLRWSIADQKLENITGNSEIDNQIAQRTQTEKGAISPAFNLGIGKKWNSGILLESGLNIDMINVTFNYLKPGGTHIIIDSFPVITMDTIDIDPTAVTSKNKFRQINIPVSLGYEIHLSGRYSVAAKAGVLVNLSSRNSGQILTHNGLTSYDSESRSQSMFRTNLNISYIAGLDLVADLSKNFSGYAGLNVNYYPDDFSLSTYPVQQTYFKYGMTAGVRYRL